MGRKQSTILGIRCKYCKDFTQSIEPIEIAKKSGKRYHIKCYCFICKESKSKFLNKEQVKLLPAELLNAADNTNHKEIIREGQALPFLTLLPHIINGISALSPIISSVISGITDKKKEVGSALSDRSLKNILQGGNISETEMKDLLQLMNGLGYACFV